MGKKILKCRQLKFFPTFLGSLTPLISLSLDIDLRLEDFLGRFDLLPGCFLVGVVVADDEVCCSLTLGVLVLELD